MKKIILTLLALGSVAGAATPGKPTLGPADTELGPVVAIQRHITDVENQCLNHITGETDEPMYAFSCRIDFPLNSAQEVVITPSPVFRFVEEACSVEINYFRGGMVVFFGNSKAPVSFEDAKPCLIKALSQIKNKIDLLIFKYHPPSRSASRK